MARSDDEVVNVLLELYAAEYGGKSRQRFLIGWNDIRSLYGYEKFFYSRFERLIEAAAARGLYLWDLGEGEGGRFVAAIKIATVDRWRRVPKRLLRDYEIPIDEASDGESEDEE